MKQVCANRRKTKHCFINQLWQGNWQNSKPEGQGETDTRRLLSLWTFEQKTKLRKINNYGVGRKTFQKDFKAFEVFKKNRPNRIQKTKTIKTQQRKQTNRKPSKTQKETKTNKNSRHSKQDAEAFRVCSWLLEVVATMIARNIDRISGQTGKSLTKKPMMQLMKNRKMAKTVEC